MSIQAKVSPLAQSVTSAAPIAIPSNGILTLTQSSNVVLDVAPESVMGYAKSGADLIVQLKSGENLRIANFYVEGQPVSQLYLVERDKLLAVDLPPVAGDGPLIAGYVPQESLAGFESLTAADGTTAGLSPGGALLAGAAIIGGGVAIANSNSGGGGGGGSDDGGVPPDTTAPAPASGLQIATDGSSISGTAEPGATVGIDSNGDGQTDVSVVVGPDGNFQIPLNPPLTNGETVSVVVTDPAGNSSPAATVQAPDFPDAPQINPSNGTSLSGTAEPGSTVVLTDGNGNPIGQTTADGNGNWSYTPDSQLPDGTVVEAVVEDAAGNSSPPASIIIDGVAPSAPVIDPSNGIELSGTAEAGSSVTLTDGSGNPIGQTTADGNGVWSYTPATPLPDGTVVNATATDPAGNTSGQGSTTVDGVAPGAPTINLSDGSSLSGTAEPGSTVVLTDSNGNPIGHTTADGSGNWYYPTDSQLPDGTVVNAVVEDAAGNSSPPASTTIDGVAPSAPSINPSNGTELSGIAEPNSTVTLTDGGGNPIGQATADGSGNWSFTPTTPIADGTVVNVVAQDAAGNTSAPSSTTVDSQAPAAPVVEPSNGSEISGTAEPGSTVTLTDGSGNPIGETTADGNGDWSFTPGTPLANGTVVNATATDPAGNTSGQGSTTVDGVAPGAPTINLSNGSSLSGTAEPNSTVTLTDGSGNPIGEVTTDGSGNWTYTPTTPIADGTVINVVAQDAAGNTSAPTSTTVDSQAPAAPAINPSNGTAISGTAEPGSTVTLTDGSGNPIGQITADGSGNWSFTPGTPLANGTVVNATATDPTGNTGPQATTTVDSVAPAAPVVEPSNGSEISGTAEPGSTVTLTDGSGNPIGETTADGNGDWSFTPGTPLANGTVVNATATDPAGNTSGQGSTTVDGVAPGAPTINLSNGSSLSGTAEPNSTVTLTDGSGNPIGEVTTDGSGNWTYTPTTPIADGTVINVVAQDAAGNTSAPTSTTVDSQAPAAPAINPSNGTAISGTAEPGSTVTLTDGSGNPIGQITADGSGNWSFTPGTPLANGTVVNATATDPTGNTGPQATTTVDSVAPAAPVVEPSNGSEISGTAEPGSTVTLTDGSGNPIGETTADGNGDWSFTPGTPLANGTVVNATATDPAGNTSGQGSTTVDGVAPGAPTINLSNGSSLSGTAEPNSTVTLTDGSGNLIGQATADSGGNWTYTPTTPIADGTVINVVAQDAAGNTSAPTSTTVDSQAPAAPAINPSNGTTISGTAEPGSTVTLTDGSGNPIGQITADGSGNWSFTPGTPLANGTVVNATATDPTGNTGPQATTTVDSVAPAAPVVEPSNGTEISGTAEAGATVILTDGGGNPIGETTTDGSGNWSFTPVTPLANGTVVNATATDPAGNTSGPTSVTVDAIAPPAPIINLSDGSSLSGTAEPNSTVTLTDGSGNPIGEVIADGSGNWSFTPATPLPNGTVVNATASDPAGNTGPAATVTVDASAPAAPIINPSNGTTISGAAEPGSTVTLTDGSGNPIGQITADGSGNWSFTPATPLPNGTVVNVTASDPTGNTGPQATTTVDSVAPAAPVVEPSNGSEISGTAEAGAKVILTDGSGNPIGETTADGNGDWSFTPATPLANGTVVNAVAQDPAGNTSGPSSVTVDAIAPPAPIINPSNGTVINGTAEPNSTVTLTDGSGNPIGEVTTDGSGNWSFTPGAPLPSGTVVNVTASDPAGNAGPAATVTVDASAPAAPIINPSNGVTISGTAEAGATVTLTDGSGNPIGQITADGSGNWSFTPGTPLANGTVVNATATDPTGNTGPQATTTVDSVAPAAPVVEPSNGSEISGTAEPGSTVTLTDGSGNPIGETTADGNGDWSFTPATPLANGTVINAVAQDPAGNASGPSSVTVDAIAPAAPIINLSDGSSLSGTAEPNSTVTLADGSGNPIGEVIADGSGNWSFTPATPLPNGTVVNATASDPAGNTGPAATVTIDASAPAAPIINPSNGVTISGTAEAGATVTLTDAGGNPIGQITADGSGNWSFTPGTPLANGTVVNATATDPTGNTGSQATTTVDSVAPTAPVVEPSNGSEISGTAEAGAKVILTDGSGNPIGETTADGNGDWSFTPATPLANGTVINAVAQDPAGNTSGPSSVTVDAIAPAAPTINLSDGSSLSGTAEPNSTVTLTDGSGNPIGQVMADGSGNWSFTPATPLPNGTVVNATASDPAGNTGPAATVTVDASAPAAPIINPSNGVTISGTAEAGATVTLTDGSGNPIGQITADGSGNWSFTPGTPLANGTVVNATATDPTGNTGPQATTTVDTVAPAAPVVEPSNGSEISGTAEAGAKVILTDGSGNLIGETTADGNGDWSFTPATPLANGTVVNAVAQDPAGNTGPQGSTTVDSVAPAAPVVNPSNGTVINGTAEPNSTVALTDGNGNPIGQITADGSGNWSFTPATALPNGTVVNATATDAAGNTGNPGGTTVDSSLPSIPQVEPSNGSVISGTADAGNTIILTDGNGNPIGQVTADGSGNWSFTPGIPLPDGTVVNAVARNPGGTESAPAVITVDGVAPAAPVVEPSNGSEISGTAEAGAKVILTDGSGNPIGETTADGSGNWSFTPLTPLVNGTLINAVAQDPAGNTSGPSSVTVDAIAPAAPIINLSDGSSLSGTAEPNSTVTLTDGSGNPIGEVIADGSGNWSFTPATPLPNGTVVNATASDPAGNTGPAATVTVDASAPAAPIINPSNGTTISGTAESGSTVTLTDGSGNPIGQITADGSGNWSFTPGTPLANGTVVNATATDPTGNTGPQATTTVDSVAPTAPVIEPSNGSEISGTAEAGAKVILTDGSGNPIGETTADGNGDWSFTPATPLANGTVINAVAQDPAGNTSGPSSITVDAIAPAAPIINLSDGSSLSGTAEPNSTVTLADGSGNPIGEVIADGSGNWSFTPATPLPNGTVVNATASDPAGNTGPAATVTIDASAPAAPIINPSNGVTISGTAEAGATVTLTDAGGNPIGQITADGSGNWSFTPGSPLPNGTVVNVTATDPTGNTGPQATTTVDSVAPAAPVVEPSNGSEISGTAEPGSTVTLTDGSGNPIGETTADGNGDWSFTPGTPLANGTVVNATATDSAGNTSGQGSTTVDGVAPGAPTINLSNGSSLSGTAEPNSTVTLTDGSGNPIGEVIADGSGNWSFTPATPLPNGTVVNATASDPAGNTGPAATVTVDASAPAAPIINPSNGTTISGTAEPGSTVTLTDGSGNPIGQITADGSGNWSFTPGTPLANGTVVNATATDPTGNTGPQATTTVDSVAPTAPVVEPSNGSEISGTAEAGAKVILTDGSGNPIGETTADGNGDWSFTPATPLANGTVVNAVAQDPAGNTGPQGSTTVDSVAPAAPVV
ncbi:Ig-like domain-containing protein, partial [Pseudomonas sp. SID14000]|uniref:Ig-like domain-containing protein n=1 Tax=Pseudomonas sp. SID14000 TaxID=1986221 RepID=UPI00111F7E1D